MIKCVVFDFDGVINSYRSGWIDDKTIPDPPVEGIREAISEIRNAGYKVVIVSTRCQSNEGRDAINKYLNQYNILVDDIMAEKPPAHIYIDDRAVCFDGKPEKLLNQISNFKPWWQTD